MVKNIISYFTRQNFSPIGVKISAKACLLFFSAILAGCTTEPTPATPQLRPSEWAPPVAPQINLYQISPRLYRSQQPEIQDLEKLRQLGIKTIINFRQTNSDQQFKTTPGIQLIHIPMFTGYVRDKDVVAALRSINEAMQKGPVLIHCRHGADRTGLISAMYRIVYQGWSKEDAINEMRNGGYGFHTMWANLPYYIEEVDIEKIRQAIQR